MLIMVSVLCLVYSGGNFTHADDVQSSSRNQLSQIETDQSVHDMGSPCKGCPQMQEEQQMHCGGQLLALSYAEDSSGPILSPTVPAHTVRDFIAQIFSPDPPPPRFA